VITLEFVYILMGALSLGVAAVNARDRSNPKRWRNVAFWGFYGLTFVAGSHLPDFVNGLIVLGMVIAASAGLGQGAPDEPDPKTLESSARRWGNSLFVPALAIPAVTLAGTFTLKRVHVAGAALVDARQVTQISLALATLVALAIAIAMLRPPAAAPIREARRLMDAVGWAAVLPQMLAALGALFALAGVGTAISTIAQRWLPLGTPFAAVATYGIGMALFTMIMGNAFAAFPVMTAGISLPIIVGQFGGNPVIAGAIGMLSGFCGTLMTPMAANFNIVPAALLELRDENAVIKAQIPTAVPLLIVNVLLMRFLVFRF
jgi:uncharacterized membrane protein